MARNLRANIPAEDALYVHDINSASSERFLADHIEGVRVAKDVRSIANQAVCHFNLRTSVSFCDDFLFLYFMI